MTRQLHRYELVAKMLKTQTRQQVAAELGIKPSHVYNLGAKARQHGLVVPDGRDLDVQRRKPLWRTIAEMLQTLSTRQVADQLGMKRTQVANHAAVARRHGLSIPDRRGSQFGTRRQWVAHCRRIAPIGAARSRGSHGRLTPEQAKRFSALGNAAKKHCGRCSLRGTHECIPTIDRFATARLEVQ